MCVCLSQTKSEMQVEFSVSDSQGVRDSSALWSKVARPCYGMLHHILTPQHFPSGRSHFSLTLFLSLTLSLSPSLSLSLSFCLSFSVFFLLYSPWHLSHSYYLTAVSQRHSTYTVLCVIHCSLSKLVLCACIVYMSECMLHSIETCMCACLWVFKLVVNFPQVVKDTVNIQIGDVNDNSPTFHGQPYTVFIPEVRPTTPLS